MCCLPENVGMKLHLAAGGFWSQCGAVDKLKGLSKKQYLNSVSLKVCVLSLFSCCFTKSKALEKKVSVGGEQLRRVADTCYS